MLGVRFHHQGRHPEAGLDCAGLCVCSAIKCGYKPADLTTYKRVPSSSDFVKLILQNCDEVSFGEERPGDLWLFSFADDPQHIAIQTESSPMTMIHAYAPLKKVVEHGMDKVWLARRHSVYRIKEQ